MAPRARRAPGASSRRELVLIFSRPFPAPVPSPRAPPVFPVLKLSKMKRTFSFMSAHPSGKASAADRVLGNLDLCQLITSFGCDAGFPLFAAIGMREEEEMDGGGGGGGGAPPKSRWQVAEDALVAGIPRRGLDWLRPPEEALRASQSAPGADKWSSTASTRRFRRLLDKLDIQKMDGLTMASLIDGKFPPAVLFCVCAHRTRNADLIFAARREFDKVRKRRAGERCMRGTEPCACEVALATGSREGAMFAASRLFACDRTGQLIRAAILGGSAECVDVALENFAKAKGARRALWTRSLRDTRKTLIELAVAVGRIPILERLLGTGEHSACEFLRDVLVHASRFGQADALRWAFALISSLALRCEMPAAWDLGAVDQFADWLESQATTLWIVANISKRPDALRVLQSGELGVVAPSCEGLDLQPGELGGPCKSTERASRSGTNRAAVAWAVVSLALDVARKKTEEMAKTIREHAPPSRVNVFESGGMVAERLFGGGVRVTGPAGRVVAARPCFALGSPGTEFACEPGSSPHGGKDECLGQVVALASPVAVEIKHRRDKRRVVVTGSGIMRPAERPPMRLDPHEMFDVTNWTQTCAGQGEVIEDLSVRVWAADGSLALEWTTPHAGEKQSTQRFDRPVWARGR